MRTFSAPLLLTAVLAGLAVAPTSLAGQPVTQTLNPPPPPYEICKAVGEGTICQGTTTFSFGPIDTAEEGPPLVCGGGATAFDVFDSGIGNSLARRIYDADGNLVKRYRYDQITDGHFSNPLSGAAVAYRDTLTNVDELAVPGDLGSATLATTGEFTLRPAHSAPVLEDIGRTVVGPDGSLDFSAGPQDLFDFFAGDTSVLEPLCAALGA